MTEVGGKQAPRRTNEHEAFLADRELELDSSRGLGWLQLHGSRPAPSHQPRSGCVLDHSRGNASVRSLECHVLYSTVEVEPTLPSFIEEKPSQLVA